MATIEQIRELFHKELESIRVELKELKNNLGKNNLGKINDEIINLKNKNENTDIEYEISRNVKKFLYEKYKGTIIKKFKIKKMIIPKTLTEQQITVFDGVYILSYNDYPSTKPKTKLNDNSELVIIEAKHHITIEQINEKILQIYKIVKKFSNEDDPLYKYTFNVKTSRMIKRHITYLSLDKITKIYFFIGGPTWEEKSIKYCEDIKKGIITSMMFSNQLNNDFYSSNKDDIDNFILNNLRNNIAVVIPSGLRYEINDFNNIIEKEGNKNNGLMMKILPNYMNFKYT